MDRRGRRHPRSTGCVPGEPKPVIGELSAGPARARPGPPKARGGALVPARGAQRAALIARAVLDRGPVAGCLARGHQEI